jgi:SAM-dependent methyltransferase
MNGLLGRLRHAFTRSVGVRRPQPRSFMPEGPVSPAKMLDSALDPHRVRRCEAWLAGWFGDEGSLYPDFTVSRGDVVLDRGCDDPAILDYCRQRGARIVGGDAASRAVGRATRVICLGQLDTADDPSALLAELARAARPGARLLLSAPALPLAAFSGRSPPLATRGYDRAELRALVEDAGLTVASERGDGFFWFMAHAFNDAIEPREGESTPLLDAWAGSWADALAGRDGDKLLRTMNDVLPLRHMLVAVKPGGGAGEAAYVGPARSWPDSWRGTPDPSVDGVDPVPLCYRAERMAGWFDDARREIVPGFSVSAEDLVLDAGCGGGGIAGICADYGARLILADVDPEKVEAAERLVRSRTDREVRSLVSDIDPLLLEDDLVTRVVCTEVLEHVPDPDLVLKELIRVGRAGALFLLTVPGDRSEATQKVLAPDFYWQPPNHIRIFTKDEFHALVERSGLHVESYLPDSFFWAMFFVLLWQTGTWVGDRHHSLSLWARTWQMLIDEPGSEGVVRTLDALMPKRQAIVARKPAGA